MTDTQMTLANQNFPRHHIAAGTFYVGPMQRLLLQAFLGTCVGLALYDEKAGIGGMIHLLLPEPITREKAPFPEKFSRNCAP